MINLDGMSIHIPAEVSNVIHLHHSGCSVGGASASAGTPTTVRNAHRIP